MALSQNTLKKLKISSRIHLFPSKDVNAMLKSILVTTANGKPQTASSRLPFAVNVMLKVPIVDVTVPRRSSVFSQSSVQISAGLTDISGLAVAAFDLINCSLSVPRLVFVFDVSQ